MFRNTVVVGDSYQELQKLPSGSVHFACTSPPYHEARAYGSNPVVWDGSTDPNHIHLWTDKVRKLHAGRGKNVQVRGKYSEQEPIPDKEISYSTCYCGAWKGELGHEPDEESYIRHIMLINKEVMRILHPTGTYFFNMGYKFKRKFQSSIPERIVIEMEKAGFYRAYTIIWEKPNPTPVSYENRPRYNYEVIYAFVKSDKYYTNIEALRRPIAEATRKRNKYPIGTIHAGEQGGINSRHSGTKIELKVMGNEESIELPTEIETYYVGGRKYKGKNYNYDNSNRAIVKIHDGKAVMGSVWKISNASFKGEYCPICDDIRQRKELLYKCDVCGTMFIPQKDCPKCEKFTDVSVHCGTCKSEVHKHFALYPESLIDLIVSFACPKEVCLSCGEPRRPIRKPSKEYSKKMGKGFHNHGKDAAAGMMQRHQTGSCNAEYEVAGYTECGCNNPNYGKPIGIDQFSGFGTTLVCLKKFGVDYFGIDIVENNVRASRKRLEKVG